MHTGGCFSSGSIPRSFKPLGEPGIDLSLPGPGAQGRQGDVAAHPPWKKSRRAAASRCGRIRPCPGRSCRPAPSGRWPRGGFSSSPGGHEGPLLPRQRAGDVGLPGLAAGCSKFQRFANPGRRDRAPCSSWRLHTSAATPKRSSSKRAAASASLRMAPLPIRCALALALAPVRFEAPELVEPRGCPARRPPAWPAARRTRS